MSESAGILKALLAARREMESPAKTATNPHFQSKYAPLDELVRVSFGPLEKHGLMLVQKPTALNGAMYLTTTIISEGGETLDCGSYELPVGASPQAMGSALTYARRYTMAAILGLAAEDDDDGNAATGQHPAKPSPEAKAKQVLPKSGDREALEKEFFKAWKGTRTTAQNADKEDWKARGPEVKRICGSSRFLKLEDMTNAQLEACIAEWTGGGAPPERNDEPQDPDGDIPFS
jgi:hypothetical protein